MTIFNADELKNRSEPHIAGIFQAGFEYMMVGIGQEHLNAIGRRWVKPKHFTTTKDFNERNELNRSCVISYPFFVSLAHNYKDSLHALFGDFYSFTYGPASVPILNLLPRKAAATTLDYLYLPHTKPQIIDTERYADLAAVRAAIKEEKLKDVLIVSDDGQPVSLCDAIDNGIDTVRRGTGGNFFAGDTEAITSLSRCYDAWLGNYHANKIDVMSYDEIKKQKPEKMPFYYYKPALQVK